MLLAVVVLQLLILVVLVMLLARKPAMHAVDERQAALPDQMVQLHAHHQTLDANVRAGLGELRRESGAEAQAAREASGRAFGELRGEISATLAGLAGQLHGALAQSREDHGSQAATLRREVLGTIDTLGATLGAALKTGLEGFRAEHAEAAGKLQGAVREQHDVVTQRLTGAAGEAREHQRMTQEHQRAAQEALHTRLVELRDSNLAEQERLRGTVGDGLAKLNTDNAAKLEEMRATVDEKLHATLHTRLTESFGQVTEQLNKVHSGLGEMSKLSEGVDDLSLSLKFNRMVSDSEYFLLFL